MAINDIVSKEMQVPALKPGEVKLFRRLLKGQIDPSTKEPYILSDYWMMGKAMVYDPFSKPPRSVLLLNEVGQRPIVMPDGVTRYEPIVEMIKWDESGEILCTEANHEKYCFLMRSNLNKSNPLRNNKKKPLFAVVDKLAEVKEELADFDLTVEAHQHVKSADMTELQVIAKKLNIKVAPDLLRTDILNRVHQGQAKNILKASSNTDLKKRIQVADAEKYDLIVFNDTTGEWFFTDEREKAICEVKLDTDRVEGLLEFFAAEGGAGYYATLAKKVKKLYEVKK